MMDAEFAELSLTLPVYPGVGQLCRMTMKAQPDVD
jgi:hypothetical protein